MRSKDHPRVTEVNVVAVEEHSKHEHLSVPISLDRLVCGEHLANQMRQTNRNRHSSL